MSANATGEIEVATPKGALRAYLRVPDGDGPWPGVVVIHDIFGQSEDNRRYVDWFAAAGYLAVAPDLYSRGVKPLCILATIRAVLARGGRAFEYLEAVRSALASRADCTGDVGVIGFCIGGGFALLLATDPRFSASSVNYGMVPEDADEFLAGACPIVGSFGARDFTLHGAAARLERALERNGVARDVKEYAEAGHAFLNNHGGVLGWAAARIGTNFEPAAAADAQKRILSFFDRHLRKSTWRSGDSA
ncbi:MAG: dienelactone hydrolase family protein [Candidatus Eremiobacteraeota bacterium]|nr:dienelactone hydrolase family protein [Candidatus Eremiobacteraeota bacterium]